MNTSLYPTAFETKSSDWNFVPAFFSGTSGIFIGILIANLLGWL